jgi:hypothetical protein
MEEFQLLFAQFCKSPELLFIHLKPLPCRESSKSGGIITAGELLLKRRVVLDEPEKGIELILRHSLNIQTAPSILHAIGSGRRKEMEPMGGSGSLVLDVTAASGLSPTALIPP